MDYTEWGKGNIIGGLYILNEKDIELRLGNNDGKNDYLQVGDKVLCVEHTGDCFYQYNLLRESGEGGLSIIEGMGFSSYSLTSDPIRVFKIEFILKEI